MPAKKDLFQPVIKQGVTWYAEYYIEVKGKRQRARYLMQHDRPLWLVYLLLGYLVIRPGEIRDLPIRNIDLKKGIVVFSGEQSKNRRNSVVTIPAQIIPLLAAFNLDQYPENY